MRIYWNVEREDIARIRALVKSQSENKFVETRIKRNVETHCIKRFDKRRFWKAMVVCLMTTQQRAGPGSAVDQFYSMNPFPLSLKKCSFHANKLSLFVENTLTKFGGIRRARNIGKEVEYNFR